MFCSCTLLFEATKASKLHMTVVLCSNKGCDFNSGSLLMSYSSPCSSDLWPYTEISAADRNQLQSDARGLFWSKDFSLKTHILLTKHYEIKQNHWAVLSLFLLCNLMSEAGLITTLKNIRFMMLKLILWTSALEIMTVIQFWLQINWKNIGVCVNK